MSMSNDILILTTVPYYDTCIILFHRLSSVEFRDCQAVTVAQLRMRDKATVVVTGHWSLVTLTVTHTHTHIRSESRLKPTNKLR